MKRILCAGVFAAAMLALGAGKSKNQEPRFQTSDRCLACHNGLTTPSGEDVSIGFDWRATIMANSSRDPYWQASVRRESVDHAESKSVIEDECSVCHMPIPRYESRLRGKEGEIFSHLPIGSKKNDAGAEDGVSCSVCHQISKDKLGTRESFNGGFVIDPPTSKAEHQEYGPFDIEGGKQRIMRTSSNGFLPQKQEHIRQSEVCATCHTLYTKALGEGGKVIGELPEQMPYQEWLNSDSYRQKQSCQDCHMPVVKEDTPISRVLGAPRQGLHRHVFVAGNFFMLNMLNKYRDELSVTALPQEMTAGSERTLAYLQSEAARIRIEGLEVSNGGLKADVVVENLGGHKLPTAYPSRRSWLHVMIRDRDQKVVFESGAIRADGAIEGNDNDSDPAKFEPHYSEITRPDQVQIYEDILGDIGGRVTTGLLTGVRYVKDNRLLPRGFDKQRANADVAVIGEAANDPDFLGGGDRVRYAVAVGSAQGPFTVEAELRYQPIGFRWANNLKQYGSAEEPKRFNRYYDSMSAASATTICRAVAVR